MTDSPYSRFQQEELILRDELAIDMPRLIAVMKDALLRELGDEIDLIIQYGSHLKGTAHPYSDLDLSYVPAHESTWKSITVVVAGVMCDLYPIHWSRLEEMADFRDPSCTVLLDHRVLYQRNAGAAARLAALPPRLLGLLQPEARPATSGRVCSTPTACSAGCYTAWPSATRPLSTPGSCQRSWPSPDCQWVSPKRWRVSPRPLTQESCWQPVAP